MFGSSQEQPSDDTLESAQHGQQEAQHAQQQASEEPNPATAEQPPQQAQQPFETSTGQHAQHARSPSPPVPQQESAASQLESAPMPGQHPTASADAETGYAEAEPVLVEQLSETVSDGMDWEQEQEVERQAMAAAQQLARDNSLALREVRQAMQAESETPEASVQEEEAVQGEFNLNKIEEVEREALTAGMQLARENSEKLRGIRQAVQEGTSITYCL